MGPRYWFNAFVLIAWELGDKRALSMLRAQQVRAIAYYKGGR